MAFEYKRITLIGASQAGKSTLRARAAILDDEEDCGGWAAAPYLATIGTDFGIRTVNGTKYQIWDLAGQERFRAVTGAHYSGVQIVTCVCDASDVQSFDETRKMFDSLTRYSSPEVVVLLVNKMEVAVEGAEEAANALGAYLERETARMAAACGRHIPLERVSVSAGDPPSSVMKKLVGGEGAVPAFLCFPNRRGSVRIPSARQVEHIVMKYGGKKA